MRNPGSLFSQQEIDAIIKESENPKFQDPRLLIIGRNRTDVIKVTPLKGLIFIKGDEKTGFEHIIRNHDKLQHRPHWRKDKKEEGKKYWKLQTHSLFPLSVTPYFDCPRIADSIYKEENLNIRENTNPNEYDLYTSDYITKNEGLSPYRLLLYKGTKIIHNLYPVTDEFTPPRIIHYKKGGMSFSYNVKDCKVIIKIPYYGRNKVLKYRILFLQDYFHKKEEILIEKINASNQSDLFWITERELLADDFDSLSISVYDIIEFPGLESIIAEIDKRFG